MLSLRWRRAYQPINARRTIFGSTPGFLDIPWIALGLTACSIQILLGAAPCKDG